MTKEQCCELRNDKIKAYAGNEKDKVDFIINNKIFDLIINNINVSNINSHNYLDVLKALFVKMVTIILIDNNMMDSVDYYTKKGLAKLLNILYNDTTEYSLYYLFRGNIGILNKDFYKTISNKFIDLTSLYIE